MEVKPGYKQTEVGVIPEHWRVEPLQRVTDCLDSLRVPLNDSERRKRQGEIPYCGANGVLDHIDDFVIDDDIILMAEDGGYFDEYTTKPIAYRMRGKCWVNNHAHILKAKSGIDQGFIYYSLVHKNILQFIASGTRAKLNRSELDKIEIPFPPTKAEQEVIAEALGDADALIEALAQLIAKKRHLKQGAMQELLTGKRRLPGFEVSSGFKQIELGMIPEDWEMRSLGDGIILSSGQHVLTQHYNAEGTGVPYLTGPADFPEGIIRQTKFTTKPGTICHSNDILVTVKGSGAGTLVIADGAYCISRQLMAIRPETWDNLYIYYSLLRDMALIGANASGPIPGLSRSDILSKQIALPPTKAEQTAIADILGDMDAEIATLEAKLTKARQLKQGMMQELLTGMTRLI